MKSNLITMILVLFLSCSFNTPSDVKDYFFPVNDFLEKKVYCFTSDNEQLDGFYWILETYKENNRTIFRTVILNEQRQTTFEVIEYIGNEGVEMKETRFPSTSPEEPYLVSKVSQAETFLWNWEQNEKIVCEYTTTFQSNGEKMKEVVFRQKEFLGQADSVNIFDKKRRVIRFKDSINQKVISVHTGEIIQETNFEQKSYWAEGIGLYRYERPDGNLILDKITDYNDWKR